ncbi:MAG: hypothetical protein V4710_15610 [Verrucomicrobiota bacterium]
MTSFLFPSTARNRLLSGLVCTLGALFCTAHSAETLWIEGEAAASSTMHRHPWWYDQVKTDLLSGGAWISNFHEKEGTAQYGIDVKEAGSYRFWVRANPVGAALAYRIDEGAWVEIDLGKEQRGNQNIAADNKPDLRYIAWSKAGEIALTPGKHSIGFRMHSANQNHGGIDCFVLTTEPFVPQGIMKPADGTAQTEADPNDAIWIEGEAATRHSMTRHPWWYDQVKKEVLSGGEWISNYNKEKEGIAEYDFTALKADDYAFWVRANPSVDAKLQWQLDGGEWVPIDFKDARGNQNIAADNKPDMRFVAWIKAGSVKLSAGKHTIRFRMHSGSDRNHHGGLDCFLLTRIPFVPAGTRKPTLTKNSGNPGDWFPLLADNDTFSPQSVIDMSRFVPAPAGQFGALRAVGKELRFEKSAVAVKLWGCGANIEPNRYSREQLTQRIKYLRKFGINVVRQHPLFDEVTSNGVIDKGKLDQFDWYFAELKKHGIYMDWSVFYHFTIGPKDGYDPALYAELEGDAGRKDTYGFITVSPKLWEIRNRTLVELLTHQNPYTGLRYADDPALAIVEMQNEDSVFFWNPLGWIAEGKKAPQHSRELRGMWAAWVKKKYQSDEALKSAWGSLREGDSIKADELKLMGPWELDGNGPRGPFAGQEKRAGDFIEFLTGMQRGFYEECEKLIRATGFKAITMTTAWQVGGAATDPANTFTDTVGSMIDRHNYAGGGAGGHGITEGKINNESHLSTPGGGLFSIGMKQVETKPFCVSEWTQSAPNQWKLEAAPVQAFYGMGLQGWDASFHFIQSGTRLGDGWPGMSSYSTDTPHYIGQFPALAFALYHGHISEAPIVAARRLVRNDLFSGRDALRQDFTKGGYDIKTLLNAGGTPAEAFAIGRVTVGFEGGKTEQADLSKSWDEKGKVIQSATGELTWDYGREVITVQTQKTQAVIGKSGGRSFQLPGVSVSFKTPFVSTIFTPLDNLPLARSRHILITALAQDKQSGTRYHSAGTLLEATGTAPLLMEPVQATVKFSGSKPTQVNALDHYGAPTGRSVPVAADGSVVLDGTYRAYYYEVRR